MDSCLFLKKYTFFSRIISRKKESVSLFVMTNKLTENKYVKKLI